MMHDNSSAAMRCHRRNRVTFCRKLALLAKVKAPLWKTGGKTVNSRGMLKNLARPLWKNVASTMKSISSLMGMKGKLWFYRASLRKLRCR